VRGLAGVRDATVVINGTSLNIAATSGLGNARKVVDDIRKGVSKYHVIEIMACPGGCINGGGQPFSPDRHTTLEKRSDSLYDTDRSNPHRRSHENVSVKKLYDDYLGYPGSEKAHQLLHNLRSGNSSV